MFNINVCFTKSGVNVRGYENGVLKGNSNFTDATIRTSSNPLYVGSGWAGNFDGRIPLVQIYNRALTASEILQNYNAQKYRFGL